MEKLIKKNLREEKSDWPMQVLTPTDPKEKEAARQLAKAARMAKLGRAAEMPRKLSMSGAAVPERKAAKAVKAPAAPAEKPAAKAAKAAAKPAQPVVKPRFGPGSEDRSPAAARAGMAKGGQAIVIGKNGKMQAASAQVSKPVQQKAAQPKAAQQKTASRPAKAGLGKPVQRVNRARGRNGER